MQEMLIKIRISDREYPLKIEPEDEKRLLKAAELINAQIAEKRQSYGMIDKQDLLAMVAFDTMVENLRLLENEAEASKKIADIRKLLP